MLRKAPSRSVWLSTRNNAEEGMRLSANFISLCERDARLVNDNAKAAASQREQRWLVLILGYVYRVRLLAVVQNLVIYGTVSSFEGSFTAESYFSIVKKFFKFHENTKES